MVEIDKLITILANSAKLYLLNYGDKASDSSRAKILCLLFDIYKNNKTSNQELINDAILYTYLAIKEIKDSILFIEYDTCLVDAINKEAKETQYTLPDTKVVTDQLVKSYNGIKNPELNVANKISVIKNELISERAPHLIAQPNIVTQASISCGFSEELDEDVCGKRSSERILLDIFASVMLNKFLYKAHEPENAQSLYADLAYYSDLENRMNPNLKESPFEQSLNLKQVQFMLIKGMESLITKLRIIQSPKLPNLLTLQKALINNKPYACVDTLLFLCEAIKVGYLDEDHFHDFRIIIKETIGRLHSNDKIESIFYYILGDMIPYSTPVADQKSGFSFSLFMNNKFNVDDVIHLQAGAEQELKLHLLLASMKFTMIRCLPTHAERSRQLNSLVEYMKEHCLPVIKNAWKPTLYHSCKDEKPSSVQPDAKIAGTQVMKLHN